MIKLLRGILVGSGLGFALYYTTTQSNEIYLASLALMVLVGILIPLEQQDRRMDKLQADVRDLGIRFDRLVESVAGLRLETVPSMQTPESIASTRNEPEEDQFMPVIQTNAQEERTVKAHGRRTVERSVEDVAKKLSSMQRGE